MPNEREMIHRYICSLQVRPGHEGERDDAEGERDDAEGERDDADDLLIRG